MTMSAKRHGAPGALMLVALLGAGEAWAYDTKDAIRDCEQHIRGEYGLTDLRDTEAVQIFDVEKHFQVRGRTKIDGEKYPWTCEIVKRRVVETRYRGPRPFTADTPSFSRRGPEVIPLRSGEFEVRLGNGCVAHYDRRGRIVERSDRCGTHDRRRADEAIDAYLRESRRDDRDAGWRREPAPQWGPPPGGPRPPDFIGAPPRTTIGRHGAGEVRYDNGCTVYYDPRGQRTGATPACREHQLERADQEMDARR